MTSVPPTYLVTGGAGFIGSHMVAHLRRERPAARVRIVDNLLTGKRANLAAFEGDEQVQVVEASLADDGVAAAVVEGVDTVFHVAALPSVPRSLDDPLESDLNNVHATVALLEAARRAHVRRVVYAASSSAYGATESVALAESRLPAPRSPYAASKLAGELYMQAFAHATGLETVCLRYFNVFGPRQDPTSQYAAVVPRFITAMLRAERPTIFGDGTQSRDFTFVENNCRANLLAAEAPAARVVGRTFNVACGAAISLLDLVARLNALLGTSLAPQFAPERAGDVKHSLADIASARDAFGFAPTVSLDEGLQRTIDWYRIGR